MEHTRHRIGVDVGGTFTDLILLDEDTGEVEVGKELSTPEAPELAVLRVVDAVAGDRLAGCRYFLHGTTVGLNSLLERTGAKVGLLATQGFRDVLEKRRSNYDEQWNPVWRPQAPLVPRRHRLPVRGRIAADGSEIEPLSAADVRAATAALVDDGIECIAIAFINAYASPAHELAAEQIVRASGFDGHVVLSHRISGEYREFERTATTVIDAYIRPRVSGYLDELERGLRARGCQAELLLTRSGGGALTFAEARLRPFEVIMSGPVGGAIGAGQLALALGDPSVIAADVGGTSFDTCLVTDGRPSLLFEGEILGLPIQAPWVDVRSIGAGGGSISWVDGGGLLRVGPHSAGSNPGPAAYARGGEHPAVTDAAVVLGMFGDARLAGDLPLDRERAAAAFEPLGAELALPVERLAHGSMMIANAMMAGTIKTITLERGVDPRESLLLMFGGAGGLFATLLARELGVRRVLIPAHPGNFSAVGLLGADMLKTHARTRLLPLDDAGLEQASGTLRELFAGLDAGEQTVEEAAVDVRYVGQEHTLTLPLEWDAASVTTAPDALAAAFTRAYDATFGHTMHEPVELVTLRATLRSVLPVPALRPSATSSQSVAAGRSVEAYSFEGNGWTSFAVVERAGLRDGAALAGPAIVVEPTSTTYLDAGFSATAHASGTLIIEREGA
jgi:N-methylhydantoinase A